MPEPGERSEADEAVREREAEKVWRDAYPDGGAEEAWRHGLRGWSLNLAEYTRSVWEYGHQTGIAAERAKLEALIPQLERALGIIENGAEMVGPDVYEFTKDEVIDEAASAIRAALDAVRAGRAS